MTPVYQTIFGQLGDCFPCCIASILDLPREAVPHFYEADLLRDPGGPVSLATQAHIREWFAARGEVLIDMAYEAPTVEAVLESMEAALPGLHYILCGRTTRGRDHAVVARGRLMVHDPYSSGLTSRICDPQSDGVYHVCVIGRLL